MKKRLITVGAALALAFSASAAVAAGGAGHVEDISFKH